MAKSKLMIRVGLLLELAAVILMLWGIGRHGAVGEHVGRVFMIIGLMFVAIGASMKKKESEDNNAR